VPFRLNVRGAELPEIFVLVPRKTAWFARIADVVEQLDYRGAFDRHLAT
jgi:hypothetical protein